MIHDAMAAAGRRSMDLEEEQRHKMGEDSKPPARQNSKMQFEAQILPYTRIGSRG